MDREQLIHLCTLARLKLTEGEIEAFETKFNSMLNFTQTVLSYEPQSGGPPLTLIDSLEPRRDLPGDCEWPAGTVHDYRVPRIIAGADGGGD